MYRSLWNVLNRNIKSFTYKNSVCKLSEVFQHKRKPSSYEDSLQFWIINKFRTDDKYVSFKADKCENYSNCQFDTLSTDYLLNYWLNFKQNNNKTILREIETELIFRVKRARLIEVITILDASLMFYNHKIALKNIYSISLNRIEFLIGNEENNSNHLLQSLYYCSLLKKSKISERLISQLIQKLSKQFVNLNNIDLGILSISLYKCSIKAPLNLLNVLIDRLKADINWFLSNPSLMTCFVKCLRHGKKYDDDLFRILIQNCDKIKKIDLIAKVHLLVYFSDSLYEDIEFVVKFISDIFEDICHDNKNRLLRFKDIDNFLWSSSNYWNRLTVPFSDFRLIFIINEILKRENTCLSEIFNTIHYLWILNVKDIKLLNYLTVPNILAVKKRNNFKDLARLSILLSCISIEKPNLVNNEMLNLRETRLQPKLNVHFKKRPFLEKMYKIILQNRYNLDLSNVQISFPVSCLFIGSVTAVYHTKLISIELCDATTCYRNTSEPNGMMSLKLRLLKQININYHLIKEELQEEIVSEIKKWLSTLQ